MELYKNLRPQIIGGFFYFDFAILSYMFTKSGKIFVSVILFLLLGVGAILYQSYINNKNQEVPVKTTDSTVTEPTIKLDSPKEGEVLDGKVLVKGSAKGWFFEGSFPARIEDNEGNVIAMVPIQSKGDWMVSDFVSFEQTIEFFTDTTEGFVILQKDNPSGENNLDEEKKIPVKFVPQEGMTVSVFFGNTLYNPNQIDCTKVYPVERVVKKDPKTATVALKELLKGPTMNDSKEGYSSSLNSGIELKSLSISNGVAKADFSPALGEGVAGSCRVGQIISQIESTLKQFPTVKEVQISIDGVSEGILQP